MPRFHDPCLRVKPPSVYGPGARWDSVFAEMAQSALSFCVSCGGDDILPTHCPSHGVCCSPCVCKHESMDAFQSIELHLPLCTELNHILWSCGGCYQPLTLAAVKAHQIISYLFIFCSYLLINLSPGQNQ